MDNPKYAHVEYLQTICAHECLITHITAIWTLPSMYTLMYIQTPCHYMFYYTHHSDMNASQYAPVDVLSDVAAA
jgi:hypothetical protein